MPCKVNDYLISHLLGNLVTPLPLVKEVMIGVLQYLMYKVVTFVHKDFLVL
jgi:hypothetical protein